MRDAVSQLGVIIEDLIKHSIGDSVYDRAVEAVGVMRGECVEMEEPAVFNAFAREFKKKLLDGDLGGDRRELWYKVRVGKLGLIGKDVSEVSDVTEEEAALVRVSRIELGIHADLSSSYPQLETTFTKTRRENDIARNQVGKARYFRL